MTNVEEIKNTIDFILNTHHYNYKSFEEAKICYKTENGHVIIYDAMSLFVYYHSMDKQLYLEFNNELNKQYHSNFDDEDKKKQKEYEILLLFFGIHREFENSMLMHITRPDFDVIVKTGESLGIEVTQLILEEDSVQNAIMRECFGRNLSAEEIRTAAIKKHGSKAKKYQYSELGGTACITSPLKTDLPEYKMYAQKIVLKLEKYRNIKDTYDRFIVLCDGRHPIFISSKYDTEQIIKEIKMRHPEKYGAEVAIIRYGEQPLCEKLHLECDTYQV